MTKTHAEFLEELKKYIVDDQIPYYESINREEPNNDTLYELKILVDKIEQFQAGG